MNLYSLDATPTVADEVSAVVDDAQVIAKTLPAKRLAEPARTLRGLWDQALDTTCAFVDRQPMQAVMIAAAASSVLTLFLTRGRPRRERVTGRSYDAY
ncbi:hypothetical protein [Variovorax sp. J22R115]|uniref:hypothetical protein n=1 Tax=Variovorax sp. J22R115 TaxID=3053509 RepID=UPI0025779E50|nr:hypothetical protein [Variovorax sp. J22R115]MDM0051001.1 hypothetical protein [Variovorax sp. J22R115]